MIMMTETQENAPPVVGEDQGGAWWIDLGREALGDASDQILPVASWDASDASDASASIKLETFSRKCYRLYFQQKMPKEKYFDCCCVAWLVQCLDQHGWTASQLWKAVQAAMEVDRDSCLSGWILPSLKLDDLKENYGKQYDHHHLSGETNHDPEQGCIVRLLQFWKRFYAACEAQAPTTARPTKRPRTTAFHYVSTTARGSSAASSSTSSSFDTLLDGAYKLPTAILLCSVQLECLSPEGSWQEVHRCGQSLSRIFKTLTIDDIQAALAVVGKQCLVQGQVVEGLTPLYLLETYLARTGESILSVLKTATQLDYYPLRAAICEALLEPIYSPAKEGSLTEEEIQTTIRGCSDFLNREHPSQFIQTILASEEEKDDDDNNKSHTSSERRRRRPSPSSSNVPDRITSQKFPLLTHIGVWLLQDDIWRVTELVRLMEHSPNLDGLWKDEAYIMVWTYLMRQGLLFLDGNDLHTKQYARKRELLYNGIVSGMGAYGRGSMMELYPEVATKVWEYPDATPEEKQYVLVASQHTLLRLLLKCRGLGSTTVAYFLNHITWPGPLMMAGSSIGSGGATQDLDLWAAQFLTQKNPIPNSLLAFDDGDGQPGVVDLKRFMEVDTAEEEENVSSDSPAKVLPIFEAAEEEPMPSATPPEDDTVEEAAVALKPEVPEEQTILFNDDDDDDDSDDVVDEEEVDENLKGNVYIREDEDEVQESEVGSEAQEQDAHVYQYDEDERNQWEVEQQEEEDQSPSENEEIEDGNSDDDDGDEDDDGGDNENENVVEIIDSSDEDNAIQVASVESSDDGGDFDEDDQQIVEAESSGEENLDQRTMESYGDDQNDEGEGSAVEEVIQDGEYQNEKRDDDAIEMDDVDEIGCAQDEDDVGAADNQVQQFQEEIEISESDLDAEIVRDTVDDEVRSTEIQREGFISDKNLDDIQEADAEAVDSEAAQQGAADTIAALFDSQGLQSIDQKPNENNAQASPAEGTMDAVNRQESKAIGAFSASKDPSPMDSFQPSEDEFQYVEKSPEISNLDVEENMNASKSGQVHPSGSRIAENAIEEHSDAKPRNDEDEHKSTEGQGSQEDNFESDATDDEQERALEVEKAETEDVAMGGEFGYTTEEENDQVTSSRANMLAEADRRADVARAKTGYASQLEEGYEPEDTHGYTEEEVSEAIHTEDEEEERRVAQAAQVVKANPAHRKKVEPVRHSGPHSSDDMDADDEHTEHEEDLGAESSELEENAEVREYIYSPSSEHERDPSTLMEFAQSAQRLDQYARRRSSPSKPAPTIHQPNQEDDEILQDENKSHIDPTDKSVGFAKDETEGYKGATEHKAKPDHINDSILRVEDQSGCYTSVEDVEDVKEADNTMATESLKLTEDMDPDDSDNVAPNKDEVLEQVEVENVQETEVVDDTDPDDSDDVAPNKDEVLEQVEVENVQETEVVDDTDPGDSDDVAPNKDEALEQVENVQETEMVDDTDPGDSDEVLERVENVQETEMADDTDPDDSDDVAPNKDEVLEQVEVENVQETEVVDDTDPGDSDDVAPNKDEVLEQVENVQETEMADDTDPGDSDGVAPNMDEVLEQVENVQETEMADDTDPGDSDEVLERAENVQETEVVEDTDPGNSDNVAPNKDEVLKQVENVQETEVAEDTDPDHSDNVAPNKDEVLKQVKNVQETESEAEETPGGTVEESSVAVDITDKDVSDAAPDGRLADAMEEDPTRSPACSSGDLIEVETAEIVEPAEAGGELSKMNIEIGNADAMDVAVERSEEAMGDANSAQAMEEDLTEDIDMQVVIEEEPICESMLKPTNTTSDVDAEMDAEADPPAADSQPQDQKMVEDRVSADGDENSVSFRNAEVVGTTVSIDDAVLADSTENADESAESTNLADEAHEGGKERSAIAESKDEYDGEKEDTGPVETKSPPSRQSDRQKVVSPKEENIGAKPVNASEQDAASEDFLPISQITARSPHMSSPSNNIQDDDPVLSDDDSVAITERTETRRTGGENKESSEEEKEADTPKSRRSKRQKVDGERVALAVDDENSVAPTTRRSTRASRRKTPQKDEMDNENDDTSVASSRRRRTNRAQKGQTANSGGESDDEPHSLPPSRAARTRKEQNDSNNDDESVASSRPKSTAKGKKAKSDEQNDVENDKSVGPSRPRRITRIRKAQTDNESGVDDESVASSRPTRRSTRTRKMHADTEDEKNDDVSITSSKANSLTKGGRKKKSTLDDDKQSVTSIVSRSGRGKQPAEDDGSITSTSSKRSTRSRKAAKKDTDDDISVTSTAARKSARTRRATTKKENDEAVEAKSRSGLPPRPTRSSARTRKKS